MTYRILLLAALPVLVCAQSVVIQSLTQPAPLAANWRYRPAADSAWSVWKLPGAVPAPYSKTATYELDIALPDPLPPEPLAVLIAPMCYAYDASANQQKIGTFGDPRKSGGWGQYVPAYAAFPLPAGERQLTLTIRCQDAGLVASSYAPDFSRPSWLGSIEAIAGKKDQVEAARVRSSTLLIAMIAAAGFAGLLFVITPLWRRDAPEYLWCGAFLLTSVLRSFAQWTGWLSPHWPLSALVAFNGITNLILLICWGRMFPILFRIPLRRPAVWLFRIWLANAAGFVFVVFILYGVASSLSLTYSLLGTVVFGLLYLDVALRAASEQETPLIHTAVGMYLGAILGFYVVLGQRLLGQNITNYVLALQARAPEIRMAALVLFALAMAIALNQRSRRLQAEVATAAQVQSLLLSAPALTNVGAAYLPASEVGGDFYQAVETPDGMLLLVGDVSGKGLPAAMRVAAILGAFRNRHSNQPAAVLSELNRVLTGSAGFTTCCCVLFAKEGGVIAANAGHPSPYADGAEVELPSGLPLGIDPQADYQQTALSGGRFTLVSDGVIEAANSQGELFGFDRTREISIKAAAEIAEAARVWGQNDDITVVTVRREA